MSDANLVLGYMDPNRVIGGDIRLDAGAARTAIAPLAAAMGMDVEEAALGVVRVANSAMLRALRRVTVERGIDGRQCTLLGLRWRRTDARRRAGPRLLHRHGDSFRPAPACSSALGCVSAQMSYAQQRTLRMAMDAWDAPRLTTTRGGR